MQFRVGNATITKIPELALEVFTPTDLLRQEDPERVRQLASSLPDDEADHAKGLLRLSIHSWLVRTPGRIILIDTGAGNDKMRPYWRYGRTGDAHPCRSRRLEYPAGAGRVASNLPESKALLFQSGNGL